MRIVSILTAIICVVASARAQTTYTNVFQQTVNTTIADANPVGLTSTQNLTGIFGSIQSVSVSLDITGGFNGDLYAYLAFGDGLVVLLNRVGKTSSDYFGYGDSGFNITLSDSAASDIHLYGGNGGAPLTGTWQPDGRNVDPQLVTATDPRTAMLSSLDGMNPNGTWTLFIADMASGYQSTLASWSLSIVTVPEPSTGELSLIGGGLIAAFGMGRRLWRK